MEMLEAMPGLLARREAEAYSRSTGWTMILSRQMALVVDEMCPTEEALLEILARGCIGYAPPPSALWVSEGIGEPGYLYWRREP